MPSFNINFLMQINFHVAQKQMLNLSYSMTNQPTNRFIATILRKKYRECMYYLSDGRAVNVTAFKRAIIHKKPSNINKIMPKKLPRLSCFAQYSWACHIEKRRLNG